ncbi:TM0106 family RecB-like putative nuclease [Bradyrhizobium brasilense]|uniref:TM0106 family RecB-like putative nuclease n=1 Tax=Bradyrhizobium brasilense TaxID=1419277 RepID=UPI0024B09C64|nr:TM0106 family RecB-like putative nuclease [Bradyrhizobium australafricanum]WFU34288.1 TM0106 family RecB-like putative nuclease [Bradyrhizobium australafricanum]
MQNVGGNLQLSSTDLVGHLNCTYLTELDLKVANGELQRPKIWDPVLETLAERGAAHEQAFVDHLKSLGMAVTVIGGVGLDPKSTSATLEAMSRGDAVIVQGALQSGRWSGRADVLLRVETPSRHGTWSYEVTDTKLARETKGNTVLQISFYSDMLSAMQGVEPTSAHVVTPGTNFEPETYRIADYSAYYRHVRASLERAVADGAGAAYPEPIEHCNICRWRRHCDERRRRDDHLSLVAGISKSQIGELNRRGVGTAAALAAMPIPLEWRPERGAAKSYEKIREQARIQVEGRTSGSMKYEALPPIAGFGLSRLPAPSRGDIFFDFEGDPFVGEGGLEFLFGYSFLDEGGKLTYVGDWASNRREERIAFERFVDFVTERLKSYPDLHIYHFAPYEPSTLKRLMGRYATRENEVDDLLRAEKFVDLFAVVRHAIRASVESYSIKKLEPLYSFTRSVLLEDVGAVMARTQARLEMADAAGVPDADKNTIRGYNKDDCDSTFALREWLEGLRASLIASGEVIKRPVPKPPEISEKLGDWQRRVAELVGRLTERIPDDVAERTTEQQARWLLAFILDFHGREKKAVWWEFFRLRDLSAEDLLHERAGLSGLSFKEVAGGTPKTPIHRYNFVLQDTDLRPDSELRSVGGQKFGSVAAISHDDRTIDIKKRGDTADLHPEAVFAHKSLNRDERPESLLRLGQYVAENGMEGAAEHRAARDLLMLVAPRLHGQSLQVEGEDALKTATRVALALDQSIFPVQGPPGAGKTFTGARMICALVRAGKRVGISANSHKVIRNLLDEVVRAAGEEGLPIRCVQKVDEKHDEDDLDNLKFVSKNEHAIDAIRTNCTVGGGTSYFWARPDARLCVDVLFIDEAAQMALANVLAVAQAAQSVVLLGDPRQLEQPIQGSHPDGVGVSALDHVLGPRATIPADRGLFLDETWRLHPLICAFNSELFYEGRLKSRPGLERQEIRINSGLNGSGLRYLPVQHDGNQSSSPEEADAIRDLIEEILGSGSTWIDRKGNEYPISLDDVLIIAPYNAQVFELQDRIPGARIGTVDKFQGQEAPIVIYSMATSSHADAPRGMEFLYSANRLNVAVSRAKCICIVVASPRLFEAECRTPRQMQLANAFCRYAEMASVL